jgi:hypothetical protein
MTAFHGLLMHYPLLQTSGHSAKLCTFKEEGRFRAKYDEDRAETQRPRQNDYLAVAKDFPHG